MVGMGGLTKIQINMLVLILVDKDCDDQHKHLTISSFIARAFQIFSHVACAFIVCLFVIFSGFLSQMTEAFEMKKINAFCRR